MLKQGWHMCQQGQTGRDCRNQRTESLFVFVFGDRVKTVRTQPFDPVGVAVFIDERP